MFDTGLTPIQYVTSRGWYVKRDDLGAFTSADMPSGAKVRQYRAMIDAAPDDSVLAGGGGAAAAMQVYIAALGLAYGRDAYVSVPRRTIRHPSTVWAANHGATVLEVVPGYPSQYRARIRALPAELGRPVVRWDRHLAAWDTADQVRNVPGDVYRVVVPSGSGLTAAGIIIGLLQHGPLEVPRVKVIATSPMAHRDKILAWVRQFAPHLDPSPVKLEIVPTGMDYARPVRRCLPGEVDELDPWYAAKGVDHMQRGELLWVVGRRPASAT